MVKIMETPIKMDDLGGKTPLFLVQHPYRLLQDLPPMKFDSEFTPAKWVGTEDECFPIGARVHFSGGSCNFRGGIFLNQLGRFFLQALWIFSERNGTCHFDDGFCK